jgi:hypothetical protein
MSLDRWSQIGKLYHAALEHEAGERVGPGRAPGAEGRLKENAFGPRSGVFGGRVWQ